MDGRKIIPFPGEIRIIFEEIDEIMFVLRTASFIMLCWEACFHFFAIFMC